MKRSIVALMGVAAVAFLAAHFWSRTARRRVLDAWDQAAEETERVWSSDFKRPSIFARELPPMEPDDATESYRRAEELVGRPDPRERQALVEILESPSLAGQATDGLEELLERHREALQLVQTGVGRPRCTPWDTPLEGQGLSVPNGVVHRFLHHLLLAGGLRAEGAVPSLSVERYLAAIQYAQDLGRHAALSSRLVSAALELEAAERLQALLASGRLGEAELRRAMDALVVLEEIEPPASETLQVERLSTVLGVGQALRATESSSLLGIRAAALDVLAVHRMAEAVVRIERLLGPETEALVDRSLDEGRDETEGLQEELAQSQNPMVSSVFPNLLRFRLILARVRQALAMGQTAAAVQLYRLRWGEYPDPILRVKGRVIRRMPVDPFTDAPFDYRIAADGSSATVFSVGDADAGEILELELRAPEDGQVDTEASPGSP